jgi:LysM repeat protein
MNSRHLQRFLTILALIILISLFYLPSGSIQAQAGSAAQVLAEINGVRASNGLEPLQENVYLNIAAQNHANWIAETGIGGHIGEDGSTATDRALAVGYGEGVTVWVTENWARGLGLTASQVVYDYWVPSTEHLANILTTWHNEFGAGVALDGNGFTVYVVNFGHTLDSVVIEEQPTITPGGPTPTQIIYIQPVTTTTPNPDGSVVHVVLEGQSLWSIAEAYQIPLADLLALNGLTEDDAIFPGETLLIVPASQEVQEPTETPEIQTPTNTPEPTHTPTKTIEVTPTPSPTPTPEKRPNFLVNIFSGDTLWIGIGLVGVSVAGIILLLYTSSRLK